MLFKIGGFEFHLDAATIIAVIYAVEYTRRKIMAMKRKHRAKQGKVASVHT